MGAMFKYNKKPDLDLRVSMSPAWSASTSKKQDAAEIKSCAQSTRPKARPGEATERVNLAFSRIDLQYARGPSRCSVTKMKHLLI